MEDESHWRIGLFFFFFADILVNNTVSGNMRFRIYHVVKDSNFSEIEWR